MYTDGSVGVETSIRDISSGALIIDDDLKVNGYDIDLVRGDTSYIHSVAAISLDWGEGIYDNPHYHGFESKNEAGSWATDLRINSYDNIVITLDSNTNDVDSKFIVQRDSIGDGTDLWWIKSAATPTEFHTGHLGFDTTAPGAQMEFRYTTSDVDKAQIFMDSGDDLIIENVAGNNWIEIYDTTGGIRTYLSGVGEMQITSNVYIQDNIKLGYSSGVDTDCLRFDEGSEMICWNNGNDRFEISDDFDHMNTLTISGSNLDGDWFLEIDDGTKFENNCVASSDLGAIRFNTNCGGGVRQIILQHCVDDGTYKWVNEDSWTESDDAC